MNVLVTGAAGFIGSHVADALLAAGHRVVVVDNLLMGERQNVPAGATFYAADIRDRVAMQAIFESEQIDAVSHQAALANVRASMADPIEYASVNVLGSLQLLELARTHGCRKFVFATTGGAVYGEGGSLDGGKLPFREESWPQPKDNYGANKLSVEYHLDLYHQNYGLPYVALRYANIYGPRQSTKGEAGVVAIFAHAMLKGAAVRINGDGEQTRDYTYVGDVANANLLALEGDAIGIFNIGTGVATSVNGVFKHLAQVTGYTQSPIYMPRPVGEVLHTYLDNRKARVGLGWQPALNLEQGLQRTVAWFKSA